MVGQLLFEDFAKRFLLFFGHLGIRNEVSQILLFEPGEHPFGPDSDIKALSALGNTPNRQFKLDCQPWSSA